MASRVEIVPINTGSNGDPSHRPRTAAHTLDDPPTKHLEKLGTLWMKLRGDARPGILYKLDKLPDGYTVWEKPRKTDPKHVDKWLFGHPNHRTFDSPNRFFPHFLHLMNNGGSSVICPCTVCNIPDRSMSTTGASKRPSVAGAASHNALSDSAGVPLDYEGTPDIFQILINKLKRDHKLDTPVGQLMSLNWRSHISIAQGVFRYLADSPQWWPRALEMVLFVREFEEDEELCRDSSNEFGLYNTKTKVFGDFPEWEAGVVGQVPQEQLVLGDLVTETEKKTNVSISGLRVEPFPDPNLASTSTKDNKFWSKRHKYVPMHHVRPFIFWQEYLRGIPEQEWHPTIKHALTVMATFAVIDKVRFRGTWPSARVYCNGMYIGSEFIVTGDIVRLMPTTIDPTVIDIMKIHSIKLKLLELDDSTDDKGNSLRPRPLVCHVSGAAYTLDPAKAKTELPVDRESDLLPREFHGYGDWYHLSPPNTIRQVPFSRILGRCYEPDAMQLWFPTPTSDDRADLLSLGAAGAAAAREHARFRDKRINNGGNHRWNFSDTRIHALDLERHVNLEVGRMGRHGDKQLWLEHCRQLNNLAGPEGPTALSALAKVAALTPNGRLPELAEDLETENTGRGIVAELNMRKSRAHTMTDDIDRTSPAGAGFEGNEFQANNIADDESEGDGSEEDGSEEHGSEEHGSEEHGSEEHGSEDDGSEGTERGDERADDENEDELAVAMQLIDEIQEPHGDEMDVETHEEGNAVMSHRGMTSALDPPRKKQKVDMDEVD